MFMICSQCALLCFGAESAVFLDTIFFICIVRVKSFSSWSSVSFTSFNVDYVVQSHLVMNFLIRHFTHTHSGCEQPSVSVQLVALV